MSIINYLNIKENPLVVVFFGTLNLLIALFAIIVTITSVFLSLKTLNISTLPVPLFSNTITGIILYLFLLIVSYGFLKLEKWGYWLTVAYYILFIIAYIIGFLQNKYTFIGVNIILTVVEFSFILPTKKYFNK